MTDQGTPTPVVDPLLDPPVEDTTGKGVGGSDPGNGGTPESGNGGSGGTGGDTTGKGVG